MASEIHKKGAGLLGMLAAALAVVAVASVVAAIGRDSASIGLISGAVSAILAAAVIWLNQHNEALADELRKAEQEVVRLESTVVDHVSHRVIQGDTPAATVQPGATPSRTAPVPAPTAPGLELGDTSDLADTETGLLGERYFVVTLDARIAAARRHLRPLALVLIEGEKTVDDDLDAKVTAQIIRETLRDADTLCRLKTGQFAVLLEDTPENGAIWTVERIRRRLNEQIEDVTIWAGIACYPANGFDGPEVLDRARHALSQAREWQQDRTEVADA